MPTSVSSLMTAAAVLMIFLAGAVALLIAGEKRFIYFPTHDYAAMPEDFGLRSETLDLSSAGGIRLRGWWIHGRGETALIYFHGNGGNISRRLDRTKMLVEAMGLDVVLVDYRGYGKSGGQPSEAGLYADGEAIYESARARGFSPEQIVLFGESLGGAVAVETALRRPVRALILEAPFLSIPAMARTLYPFLPDFLVRTRMDNQKKISRVAVPKLIVAAEKDEVVPLDQTRRLFELAREPKTLVVVPGATHNNIYIVDGVRYLAAWRGFLTSPKPTGGDSSSRRSSE